MIQQRVFSVSGSYWSVQNTYFSFRHLNYRPWFLSQDEIQKEYIEQEKEKEWIRFKVGPDILMQIDSLFSRRRFLGRREKFRGQTRAHVDSRIRRAVIERALQQLTKKRTGACHAGYRFEQYYFAVKKFHTAALSKRLDFPVRGLFYGGALTSMVESFLLTHILYKPILRRQDTKLHAISTQTVM